MKNLNILIQTFKLLFYVCDGYYLWYAWYQHYNVMILIHKKNMVTI